MAWIELWGAQDDTRVCLEHIEDVGRLHHCWPDGGVIVEDERSDALHDVLRSTSLLDCR